MSKINIPKENEGFIYTILSFERNVEIKCNKYNPQNEMFATFQTKRYFM